MNFIEPGTQMETEIVAISGDYVFLNMNAKSEGVLEKAELVNEKGELSVKEGDKIKVYFIGAKNGEMRFTTKISGEKADKNMIENAFKNHIPIEGHVEKEIKGGYEVRIGNSRAFCPYSQMGFKQKEEASFYIGQHLTFIISEYKNDGRNILVSNRAIGESAYQNHIDELKLELKEGMLIKGSIVSLHDYGAFVDIGGFQALLPVSEISRDRVEDINSVLSVGQEIEAKILKIDWDKERISVSTKALQANPWDTVSEKYKVDDKVEGKIVRIAEFGLFVNLEPGIDGLVHISELSDVGSKTNLKKLYKVGDAMSVLVNDVDKEGHRLSLRPVVSNEEEKETENFLGKQDEEGTETYNPFAALLAKNK